MVELPVDAFGLRHSVCAIPREDHVSHLEGVTPSMWQAIPCKTVGEMAEEERKLAYRGLIFVAPDGAARLFDNAFNITE